MANLTSTTTADFRRDVLDAAQPVLVDFWAPWCGPCRTVAPVLEQLAATRADVRVVQVNVDDEAELAAKYKVRGIPFLALFRDGELAATRVGAAGLAEISAWLDEPGPIAA